MSIIDFHDYCESDSIVIHINSVSEKSFRFIDVEEIQKKLIHVIDDFFARRHNANKVQHFETQTFIKKKYDIVYKFNRRIDIMIIQYVNLR